MAIGKKVNIQQTAILATDITASLYAVSYIASLAGQSITEMFISVPLNSVVTATIGTKILAFLGGYVTLPGFFGTALVAFFISAMVVVMLGEWMIDTLKLPTFKGFAGMNGRIGRLASVILYGAIPVYVVLIGLTNPGMTAIIGVAIHTFAVATVSVWIAGMLNLKI